MIAHYSDHAANERTFLAWVRTAIAVMAFGFLVTRFDVFLQIAARSPGGGQQHVAMPHAGFGGAVGAVLIAAGTAMVALAALRFVHMRRAIDSAHPAADTVGADLMLAAMMAMLGLGLVIYLVHTLISLL